MSTITRLRTRNGALTRLRTPRHAPPPAPAATVAGPGSAFAAARLLRGVLAFIAVFAGLDKLVLGIVDWGAYLWAEVPESLGWSAGEIMKVVGVLELVIGIAVFMMPRIGAAVLAGWLALVTLNLVLASLDGAPFWGIALRDAGLVAAAAALAMLTGFTARRWRYRRAL